MKHVRSKLIRAVIGGLFAIGLATGVATTLTQPAQPVAAASTITPPTLSGFPGLANFYMDVPGGSYVLYNADATLGVNAYNPDYPEAAYGFYVMLPNSLTSTVSEIQPAVDDWVTRLNAAGGNLTSIQVYQLADTTNGRQVFYFRPNDGATIPGSDGDYNNWVTLNLPIHTAGDVAGTPASITMNANTEDQLATQGVLFAGAADIANSGNGAYPSVSATSLGISDAPDQYVAGIVYAGIGRTLSYTHANVTDTYHFALPADVDLPDYPISGQDGTTYERSTIATQLAANLAATAPQYHDWEYAIDSGTLSDTMTFEPTKWQSDTANPNVAGHSYTITATPHSTITVRYVNQAGTEIVPSTTQRGAVGDAYTIATPDLSGKGYQYAAASAALTGNYLAADATVTLTYQSGQVPEPVTGGTLTVRFVDAAGNRIAPDLTKTGSVGNGYAVTAPSITGYTYSGLGANSAPAVGQFGEAAQTVTFVYQKNVPVTPSNPASPSGTMPDSGKAGTNATKPAPKTKATAKKRAVTPVGRLPRAGERQYLALAAIGVLTVMSLAAIGWQTRRN